MQTPSSKPKMSSQELDELLRAYNIDRVKHPMIIVGIRGYYMNQLGEAGKNDRNIYDDAIFLESPNVYASFNGNCDPSLFRKDIANLKPGVYYAHCLGFHKNQYMALVQRKGKVTVIRDGNPPKEETGWYGINIHKGSVNSTSSLGCQTIHPGQWDAFINMVSGEAKRLFAAKWQDVTIPYVLIDNASIHI